MHVGKISVRPGLPPDLQASVGEAIAEAERGNRGEVRVHVERRNPRAGPRSRAGELFRELGMHDTREGTAVLLYVCLDEKSAAVWAGAGIEGAAEPGFWDAVVERIERGARDGDLAGALVHAVGRIGTLLRLHVPGDDDAGNELPDAITSS